MAIIGIVAVSRNLAIGRGGKLPWHFSSDLRFFREQTSGNACVMGHKTWLTLKKPLPNRLNIVMSRRAEVESQPSVITVRDKPSVLALKTYLACDLLIIGGAEIYETFSQDIDEWIVTEIPLTIEDADKFMPEDFLQNFKAYKYQQLEEDLRVTFYERTRQG